MIKDGEPVRVLSITDYDSFQRLNELRFRMAGLEVKQVLAPKFTPTGLTNGKEEINLTTPQVIFWQLETRDLEKVLSVAKSLKERTSNPIILGVYDVGLKRNEISQSGADLVVDIPDGQGKFDQLVKEVRRLASLTAQTEAKSLVGV